MIGIRGFIEWIRFFFSANPKRTKLLGIIFVAITLPLIVITALTVQNLQQKASVSDVVIITDSNGTPITSTADPNVFISINLNTSTQWKLPQQPSSYDGFIKQTYAAGESCANIGNNSCTAGESCKYNSCDEDGNCTGTCQPNQNQQGDYSQLPTSTPTPVRSNVPTPTTTLPAITSDSCSKLNPTLYQCAQSCDSLGKEWTEQTSWQNISCPKNSNNQDQQCCYYQPTYLILKTVFIENKDTDGSSGGSKPTDPPIDVKNGEDIAHIPWKLNDLLPGQTQAPRTIQVFLSGDGQTVSFVATINFMREPTTTKIPEITNPIPITSCGEITKGGNYILDTDLSATGNGCLNIENLNDIIIDCKGHSITTDQSIDPHKETPKASLILKNVKNFSINSCILKMVNAKTSVMTISASSNGVISKNTFFPADTYPLIVDHTSDIRFSDNIFYVSFYQQDYSNNNTIENNIFSPTLTTNSQRQSIPGVIVMNNGNHNIVSNNKIDGKWDGIIRNDIKSQIGADDGIVLSNESEDIIQRNEIRNNWDCGIETVGLIQNIEIKENTIIRNGVCGIGAWYWNSWKGNLVSKNTIDSAPKMFSFFRTYGLRAEEDFVYFIDNVFSENTFLNPTKNKISSYFDVSSYFNFKNTVKAYTSDEKDITDQLYVAKNNKFIKNDFNSKFKAPIFAPILMVIDGGENTCGNPSENDYPTNTAFPLKCVTNSMSTAAQSKIYDLNEDGEVNCKDTMIIYEQLQQGSVGLSADFNNDGKINEIDLNAILRNYTPGDTTVCD